MTSVCSALWEKGGKYVTHTHTPLGSNPGSVIASFMT